MSRPYKPRKVLNPPKMAGFKPHGIALNERTPAVMQLDEYECLRLINYDLLSQAEAASRMNISRPTLSRIYSNALKVIAMAFAEGLSIEIRGGDVEFKNEWFKCVKCFKLIEGLENHVRCSNCSSFSEKELVKINNQARPLKSTEKR
jgi:uncharacterized protein